MSELNLKSIAEDLIETFDEASLTSIEIFKKGLDIKIKDDVIDALRLGGVKKQRMINDMIERIEEYFKEDKTL